VIEQVVIEALEQGAVTENNVSYCPVCEG